MLLEREGYFGLGMDALVTVCSWNMNVILVWACHRMLLESESYFGLGMDDLVPVCSWNAKVVLVWAWMLLSPYALGT